MSTGTLQDSLVWIAFLVGAWGTIGNEERGTWFYFAVACAVLVLLVAAMTVGASL